MMTRLRLTQIVPSGVLLLALAGCGGSKKAPAAPAEPAESSAVEAPAAPAPEASAEPPASSESESESEKPSQPPVDLLIQTDEAFVINFGDSDIGAAAEKKCASDNPAKAAKCKTKKRSKFLADVLQFKSKNDKVTFTIYKRKGKRVTKLSSNEVKLTQKSDNTVTVEITDKSHKPRVLFPHARKFEVKVPNDYSIELNDPRYGKLVYEGKVDILGK